MDAIMKSHNPYSQESPFRRWWNSLSFLQKRMFRMLLSLAVMIICFPLYYLGLFGTVEGPLHPSHFGDFLAGLGVTRFLSIIFFVVLLIITVSWNWVYNLVSWIAGIRRTCTHSPPKEASVCGAVVKRIRGAHPETGNSAWLYVCAEGHQSSNARFHPVRKGTFSHCLWALALVFTVIVFFF